MMAEVDEVPSFKLFGAVILKEDKRHKKGEEEEATVTPSPSPSPSPATSVEAAEAAARVAAAAASLPCPRCKSTETKFCYFNNYNVNQPRHFCKACHRYWTAGGTLRNVPIGAGRRRGRPAAAQRGGAVAGGVLEYPSPPYLGQRWLLRPAAPPRSEPRFYGGLR